MKSLDDFASGKLAELEQRSLRRWLAETDPRGGAVVDRAGRRLISFCSNDYLNLSQHPEIKKAATEAIERYGAGSGASRLVTGNHPLFAQLEERLARLKGTAAACVFGSGYLTNLGVIPTLVSSPDLIVVDALSHACIHGGARLSGARVEVFRHNDVAHAADLLDANRAAARRALIVTDGVFSMDGDLAPTAELSALAQRFDAWLMTDDAHGIGVLGGGRGSRFVSEPLPELPLQMGTLSKALGSYGGYLCASQPVVDLVRNRARSFVYSTGLPAASVSAAIAALELIGRDPAYAARPVRLARRFTAALGLPAAESCIVPLMLGEPERALEASSVLEDAGYLVTAIRPPTVPQGTARLRITFSAGHDESEIDRLAHVVRTQILDG